MNPNRNSVKFFWDDFSGTETVYAEVTIEVSPPTTYEEFP